MKKHLMPISLISFSLIVMLFSLNANASFSSNFNTSFGGRIIDGKSLQVKIAEETGFICVVPGKTITVKPVKYSYPTEYFIPPSYRSNQTTFRFPKLILGLYTKNPEIITCTQPETGATITIELPIITKFGTS